MTVTRPKKKRARRRVHTTLGDHRPRPPRVRVTDPVGKPARSRRTADPAAPPAPDTPAEPSPSRQAARKRRDRT